MRKTSAVLLFFSIALTSSPAFSGVNDFNDYVSNKNNWANFDWSNVYKTKLLQCIKWTKNNGIESAQSKDYEYKADTNINGINVQAVIRENNSDINKFFIVLSVNKASKDETLKLLEWCINNYGTNFIESHDLFKFSEKSQHVIYYYQWVFNNTVVKFNYSGFESEFDKLPKYNASVVFNNSNTATILKPDIKLKCVYTIDIPDNKNKNIEEYYVLNATLWNDGVRNENMWSLPFNKAKIYDETIKINYDSNTIYQEVDISRLTGKMTGNRYLKKDKTLKADIDGRCEKYDSLTPKF